MGCDCCLKKTETFYSISLVSVKQKKTNKLK